MSHYSARTLISVFFTLATFGGTLSACSSGDNWSYVDDLSSADCTQNATYSELNKFADDDLKGKCIGFICEVRRVREDDTLGCYFEAELGDWVEVEARTEKTAEVMRPIMEDEIYEMTAVIDGFDTGKNGFGAEVSNPQLVLVSANFVGFAD